MRDCKTPVLGLNLPLMQRLETLREERIQSVSLYLRHFTATMEFDRESEKWVKKLTDAGQAGVIVKTGRGVIILMEVVEEPEDGREQGLIYLESAEGTLRFDVPAFQIVSIVHPHTSASITMRAVTDYLERVKHRLYSEEDSAIRPRDFAVDLFDYIVKVCGAGDTTHPTRITDLSEHLIRTYLQDDSSPKTRAPCS